MPTATTTAPAMAAAKAAWPWIWRRLWHPRTCLFYDFASSLAEDESRFAHLPTPAEIARQFPNTNGWATGMEDSTITGGVMLAAICDRFAATGEEHLREEAARVFSGLERVGTASREPGLVLRSVSPLDGKSYYIETSRDQLTHFAHGCWRFHHSPLATDAQRLSMQSMLTALSERLARRMDEVHGYHVGKENGEPGLVDAMWNVAPHEVGRLPMIYGITWQLTGDDRWRELYRRYVVDAAEQAARIDPSVCCLYGVFQHQVSLEVLHVLAEDDPELQTAWRRQMQAMADYAATIPAALPTFRPVDIAAVDLDWRHWPRRDNPWMVNAGYQVPTFPTAVTTDEFKPLREGGEALLIQLMCPGRDLPADQAAVLDHLVRDTDFSRCFTYGMIYPQAAWWRAAAGPAMP